MNRDQIQRAERISETLMARRMATVEASNELKRWKRSRSLATTRHEYTFTDEQFRIALASLEKGNQ